MRAGGKGNATESNVLWRGNDQSRIGTPLLYDGRIDSVGGGRVTCVDVKSGERVFQGRLASAETSSAQDDGDDGRGGRGRGGFGGGRGGGGGFGGQDYSSPVAAGGKIYFIARSGDGYVLEAGKELRQLAHNRFEDGGDFSASPAISDGALFIRSSEYLYCVAESGGE